MYVSLCDTTQGSYDFACHFTAAKLDPATQRVTDVDDLIISKNSFPVTLKITTTTTTAYLIKFQQAPLGCKYFQLKLLIK